MFCLIGCARPGCCAGIIPRTVTVLTCPGAGATIEVDGVIQRVFTEIIGKPFLRGLLFPYFLFLLAVSAADAGTNWEAQRLQMSTLPPAVRTPLFVGLICSWCLVAGRALRPVWRDKTLPFLVRQPMGPWELSARLLPSLSVALIPVVRCGGWHPTEPTRSHTISDLWDSRFPSFWVRPSAGLPQ